MLRAFGVHRTNRPPHNDDDAAMVPCWQLTALVNHIHAGRITSATVGPSLLHLEGA